VLQLLTFRPILAARRRRWGEAEVRKSHADELSTWDVFKIVKKSVWLGTVEAPDRHAAIEKAVQEFKTEAWRLYAVQRR
jgi:hypothetical protein